MSHPCPPTAWTPVVWSIAGADPSAGAGIQADLKTFQALGVYGCSVITALTAQNTQGVTVVEAVSLSMLTAQLRALADDLPPKAIKLGMMGSPESIEAIAKVLRPYAAQGIPIIVDPVMVATSGDGLVSTETLAALKTHIFPITSVLTPNLPEAETLLGRESHRIQSPEAMFTASLQLRAMGPQAVILKGGHAVGEICYDLSANAHTTAWLLSPRQATRNTHGTGCTFSAALVAAYAHGQVGLDAAVIAKAVVNQGLRLAPAVGQWQTEKYHGPLYHGAFHAMTPSPTLSEPPFPQRPLRNGGPIHIPQYLVDMPELSFSSEPLRTQSAFPSCGPEPLGLYPVVPSAEWIERLARCGVSTLQLRIKSLQSHDTIAQAIAHAVAIAQPLGIRLFINDYWQLAIRYGAYGVHLGQSDLNALNASDWQTLRASGVRLGVSTHSMAEVARALAVQPSYIAIGPIFPTTTKNMPWAPQGRNTLAAWQQLLGNRYPLVAIGGIFLKDAPEIAATGVSGIAVVRDIVDALNPEAQVALWQSVLGQQELTPERQASMPPATLTACG